MSRHERRLLRKLKERDESAFRQLLREHGDRVYNVCFRMLGTREEAEDVAQEVFITVFKSIDSFRGDAKLSTWLYRVATNHCKNRIKYLIRRHEGDKGEYEESREVGTLGERGRRSTLSPEDAMVGAEFEQGVQRAIAQLPEDQRELLVLRDMEELSYEEIVAVTQLAIGTIKSRLHRARAALRKEMLRRRVVVDEAAASTVAVTVNVGATPTELPASESVRGATPLSDDLDLGGPQKALARTKP